MTLRLLRTLSNIIWQLNNLVSDVFIKCTDAHAYNTRAASSVNYAITKMRTDIGK